MISVLLVEDHQIVRQGLRALLEAESDFSVIGETGDGLEAVRLAERLQPDVMVLDLTLPSLSGLEVLREVVHSYPRTRVVILSMRDDDGDVRQALKHGASAYVLKDSNVGELAHAIREIAAGRRYLSPTLAGPAIDAYVDRITAEAPDAYESLTARERQVLHLAAEGHNNPEIAARLFISRRTVETHRANLMHKLGVTNQAELVRYAMERGLIGSGRAPRT